MSPRQCPQCGETFKPKRAIQQFCSPECGNRNRSSRVVPQIDHITPGGRVVYSPTSVILSDNARKHLHSLPGIGRTPETVQKAVAPRGGIDRIAVIPDIHAPFEDEEKLNECLSRTKGFEIGVVMGDVMDMYAGANFIQYEKVRPIDEIRAAERILERIVANYGQVHLIAGNHDDRPEKRIRERFPVDMVELFEYMAGGELNPLLSMCRNKFPTIKVADNVIDGKLRANWFCKIGDAVFSHAEKYSSTPGAALRGVDQWFTDFEKVVGVEGYKVVVQAHTHTMALFPWKSDKFLVECGCLCKQHGYQFRAKIGGRPQRRGYVTLEQVDGVTDPNSIRLVWLG